MEQKHRLKDINSLQAVAIEMKFLGHIMKQKMEKVRSYEEE